MIILNVVNYVVTNNNNRMYIKSYKVYFLKLMLAHRRTR